MTWKIAWDVGAIHLSRLPPALLPAMLGDLTRPSGSIRELKLVQNTLAADLAAFRSDPGGRRVLAVALELGLFKHITKQY